MRQYLKIFRLILVLAIFFQPAVLWSKSKDTAKKAEKAETTTPSGSKAKTTAAPGNILSPKPVAQDDTPLIIQRLYLKSNTIHVDLARSGGAALKPTDYPAIKLKVEIPGHKIPGSWALLQVDPQRRLTRLNGLVTFDTRLAMRKPGPVKAQLIKGKWVHAKTTTLRPLADKTTVRKPVVTAPLASQAAGMPVQGAARPAEDNPPSSLVRGASPNTGIAMPTAAARSIIEERLGGAGEPRAVFYDGGIAIDQPAEGAEFDAGSTITVRYEITREAEAGDIRIAVVRPGHTVATVTRPYTPPGADAGPRFHTVELTLPRHIDTSDRYLVFAQLGETRLHGMSHLFTINGRSQLMRQAAAPRPGVDIISPLGGDTVVLNAEKEVRFRTPDADSDAYCGGRVTVATVRMADGHETRIAYNMAVAPGENRFTWEVSEDDYSIGDYQLKFIMENGCVVRTAPFHVSGCDYALESVSFADGRSLASGIDVGAGRSIRGAFRVTVRWNGIPLPPIFAPGTDWGNQLRVTATRTGQVICVPLAGADFNYAAASGGLIAVDVPFSFDRDDVAAMRTESRNVPLEFSLHPYGASLDTDEDNNTLRTQMKVLNLRETDFHIGIYAREFHLERFLHTAGTVPKYEYRFSQTIHLRNRTLNDAGGSPAPVDSVPVEWRVEWRPAGASEYSALPLSSGRFQFTHVTGDWQTINLTERFETLIDDPGRNYRLVVVADPDHDFLDPDRRSNLSRVNIGNPD